MEELKAKYDLIPVCPEAFGLLPIPHEPSERVGERVLSKSGKDVTAAFQKGAEKTLTIARAENVKLAVLKERSPSCGCGSIYDGTFTGTVAPGNGVAAELLAADGVRYWLRSLCQVSYLDWRPFYSAGRTTGISAGRDSRAHRQTR